VAGKERYPVKIDLSENALRILNFRYLKKDIEGNVIETPGEMFERVALHVARAEKNFREHEKTDSIAQDFLDMMSSLEFLPNTPTLINAGRELGQLAACFVLPVEDSLGSIFESIKNTALIHQSGGGTGFSFSNLRPKNDIVSTTSGTASGPVSFMEVFNQATDTIKQGGTRRGANMAVLKVDHPDIQEFITVKRNPEKLTSFNLSVMVTDVFMDAVKQDREYPLINPRNNAVVRNVRARDIFDLIVQCSWEDGEPGVLFFDEINRHNPTPLIGTIESTNPCGEQPLLPYESCNLGSINLTRMVKQGVSGVEVDWDKLARTIRLSVRFLDNVVEVNRHPLPQISEITLGNRKIGLGVMGFAHFLIQLGITYNSEESIRLAGRLMKFIQEESHNASLELAMIRGSFPNFSGSIYDREGISGLRNATVTTIAPTGSLSLIAGCSSGIEPLYALYYTRILPGDIGTSEMDPLFMKHAEEEGILTPELVNALKKSGSLPPDPHISRKTRDLFVTVVDIPPSQHVRIQSAFQAHTDNAVSKTINFPNWVTTTEIREAMLLAYELKCKGITVYRDGTRARQILTCGTSSVC
jgi:ribonucleoside-diphosphate reductase alpha chain